jgi:hypothetical protein
VLLVRVDLSKAGPVRVRLLRRGHALATLRSRIGARPTTLRLHVPASAPAGRYTIEVVAGSGPTAKRVLRSVTLRG